jgi:hypothetical protein
MGDVLHDGHMEMISCLENAQLRSRRTVHLGGGHSTLDIIIWLGFLYAGLGLARECLCCDSVHARGVDPMDHVD